jgi:hypothetical protein
MSVVGGCGRGVGGGGATAGMMCCLFGACVLASGCTCVLCFSVLVWGTSQLVDALRANANWLSTQGKGGCIQGATPSVAVDCREHRNLPG